MARSRDPEAVEELKKQFEALQQQLRQLEEEPPQRAPKRRAEPDRGPDGEPDPKGNGQLPLEGFQVFTGRRVTASSLTPRAAIQRRGNLSLNRAAISALGQPEAVTYAYNPGAREIAIQAATKALTYAMPVRQQVNSESYLVSAGSFLNSIGLELDDAVMAFESVEVRGGALILALDSARKVTTRSRRRTNGEDRR